MKITSNLKTIALALVLGMFSFACSQETQNETNEEVNEAQTGMDDTSNMNDANNEMDREYRDFDAWVTTNSERAETVTADEYRELRSEYNRRSAELDSKSSNWDEETRRAWEETKADWNDFENKVQSRLGKIDDEDTNKKK